MKVHHIALSVRNLGISAQFYQDNFGFVEVGRFERKDIGGKSIFLELGNIRLEIWEFDRQIENQDDFSNLQILGIKHIAFEVSGLEHIYKKLRSKNIEISEPKIGASGARYAFLKDPDGIPVELYESL